MKKISQVGEFELIKKITGFCPQDKSVFRGIGDDAAAVNISGDKFLLFTADMLIEGVHFLRKHPAFYIGHKSLAASISDIAAMGGVPKYALISLGLPKDLELSFVENLYRGMRKTARDFKVSLIGGDTNSSKNIIIDVFLCGTVEKKNIVLRSTAKNGDLIFVTGKLGGTIRGKHLKFVPRVREARFLVKKFPVSAMIDISDGLLQDLGHILEQSNKGAVLYKDKIPVSRQALSFSNACSGGEDFELLFCVARRHAKRLLKTWPFKKTAPLSCVGEITAEKNGFFFADEKGNSEKIKIKGYRHF